MLEKLKTLNKITVRGTLSFTFQICFLKIRLFLKAQKPKFILNFVK